MSLNQSLNFSKTVWFNSLSGKCIESNSFFKNVACVSLGIHERCTKFPRNLWLFLHGRKRDVPVISIVLYYLFLFIVDIKYCRMLNQTWRAGNNFYFLKEKFSLKTPRMLTGINVYTAGRFGQKKDGVTVTVKHACDNEWIY